MADAVGPPEWRRWDDAKARAFLAASVISAGAVPLFCFYHRRVGQKLRTTVCHPDVAEFVNISIGGVEYVAEVYHHKTSLGEHLVVIEVDCIRYVASSRVDYQFSRVPDVPINFPRFCDPQYEINHDSKAIHEEYCILAAQYGKNVMKIPESGFLEVLIRHVLSPFYIFQYFAAIVWFAENYWVYATLILCITFGTIYLTTKESLFNLQSLRMLAGMHNSVKIISCRYLESDRLNAPFDIEGAIHTGGDRIENIQDSHLVPGDKIVVQEAMVLPCDAVLISGKVVVDESMLTGESIPVAKVPVELQGLSDRNSTPLAYASTLRAIAPAGEVDIALQRSGSVLFGGTKVKACYGEQCVAVCYRTSFRSSKGQLVASLLKPKEGFITFIADALWVLLLMFLLSSALYTGVAVNLVKMGLSASQVALHYLDAITISVPPALTACLTVATAIAINRLKKSEVFVTDTSRVNFAGMISAACFDKTGTLTENSLQFLGAVCSGALLSVGQDPHAMEDFRTGEGRTLPLVCQQVMAACHSLTVLGAGDSTPNGDPLEVELLLACKWSIKPSSQSAGQLLATPPVTTKSCGTCAILKHFEFTPDRLRAATLLRDGRGKLRYLLKGSPEVIVRLSQSDSVPYDVHKELSQLARKGYRVISMAYRDCDEPEERVLAMTQDEIEALGGIRFAGLLYLSSALKEDTTRTMLALRHARIHTNMITGDHIHTAIAIAGQCKLSQVHASGTSPSLEQPAEPSNVLFIIDEDERTGGVAVTDHATDLPAQMPLPEILGQAALSLFSSVSQRPSARESLFAFTGRRAFSLLHHRPSRGVRVPDSDETPVANPLFPGTPVGRSLPPSLELAEAPGPGAKQPVVEIAVTGKGLQCLQRQYGQGMVRAVVRLAKIFARMKPHDKKFVVDTLAELKEFETLDLANGDRAGALTEGPKETTISPWGSVKRFAQTYTSLDLGSRGRSPEDLRAILATINKFEVLFCGDGANDMIALRAATVGVSLCDAETSVAAPITSKRQSPSAVVEVMRQGRCSLITAHVLILFNIMYGVIQLFMACELYAYGLKAGDYMYLIQDLFYTLVLGLAISYSHPSPQLAATLPPQRFLSPYFLTKLFVQLVTFVSFQAIALQALSAQGFYDRYETDDPLASAYAQESAVANNMALAQLMIASIVSSIGEPFRVVWMKNAYHWAALIWQGAWLLVQVFAQDSYFLQHSLEIHPVPVHFGCLLIGLMVANLLVCVGLNTLVDRLFLAKANERWYEKLTLQMVCDAYCANSTLRTEVISVPAKIYRRPQLR